MGKVLIVLDEEKQLWAQRICLDRDPEEALAFLLECVRPQLHKRVPCMDKALEMHPPQQ